MPLPTLKEWKAATHKWFSRRDGAIAVIDAKVDAVEKDPHNRKKLVELREAIDAFKKEKNAKYGDYKRSAREGAAGNITTLEQKVQDKLHALDVRAQISLAMKVCATLFDIRIADVDFSENVKAAAKARMINGKSLYQTVKDDWMSDARLGDYQGHEKSMTQAKLKARLASATIPLTELDKIAAIVKRCRYAVCESITATIISECKAAGFGGRMEWIGIPYAPKIGHSVCVVNRAGILANPATWGNDVFIIDLWYYNLGMKPLYLWSGHARRRYIDSEIVPFLATSGGLQALADIP